MLCSQIVRRAIICAVQSLGIYLHIPCCESKCRYCDFNSYGGFASVPAAYLEALLAEIGLWGRALADGERSVDTAYFGGGTPSLLSPEQLHTLLEAMRAALPLDTAAEVTLEANPSSSHAAKLRGFREAGVNRLSLGIQSLDDELLSLLGRRHTAAEALEAFAAARQAGFANVNLDLMYGLPSQSLSTWKSTLSQALALRPEHLSLYPLTQEEGTPLQRAAAERRLPTVDEDAAAEMYCLACTLLEQAGYRQYEISNWATGGDGLRCRHNLGYWTGKPYLGIGAGAHSFLPPYRFCHQRDPERYHKAVALAIARSLVPAPLWPISFGSVETWERLSSTREFEDALVLGLRLTDGVDASSLAARYGRDPLTLYSQKLAELSRAGLLSLSGRQIRLTNSGLLLANEVFLRLISPQSLN